MWTVNNYSLWLLLLTFGQTIYALKLLSRILYICYYTKLNTAHAWSKRH
jgi:hypothetical protein